MRIGQVVAETGIPKRTIYFYINQKLISPNEDPENGYHDFTEEDVKKLIIISRLRKLDFSLADIRSMLRFPGTAYYYFYQQMDLLSRRIDMLRQNVDILGSYFENAAAPIDCDSLLSSLNLMAEQSVCPASEDILTDQDARIIPLFIWSPYLNQPRTEYQEFIWNKISKKVTAQYGPFLRGMKRIISSLQPEQLQYSSDRISGQAREIAFLSPEETDTYADKMLHQIEAFLTDERLVEKWNLVYHPFIYPLLTIGYSEISGMMFEMNDEYKCFYDNICILCGRLWETLHDTSRGRCVFERIRSQLLPVNWEQNGKGELERMSVFSFSPYAILDKKELEKIIHGQ